MNIQEVIRNNAIIRRAVVDQAMPMSQPLPPQSVSGTITANNNIVTFTPKLTGLLVGFLVEVNCTVRNAGASNASRSNFGAANFVDRIQFTDPYNFTRHNSKGYHFAMLNSAKLGGAWGGAYAPNLPYNVGNINTVQSLAATINAGATQAGKFLYFVPVAYSWDDLRGAIFSQVINATMTLQIQLNANAGYTTGDQINAVAGGANTTVTLENATITVTQLYYDQLPTQNGKPLLPVADLSETYMLNDTTWSPLVANQDNTWPYANFRTFLSTFAVFDNAGTFNTGSDVDYWALQYANGLRQFQMNPATVQAFTRNQIGFDYPPGVYYIDHRNFPISTLNYGNCELVLRPSSVTAGAFVQVLYEQFARQNAIVAASSLPQG